MPLEHLSSVLRVMFIGSLKPNRHVASRVLGIRLKVVWRALSWLTQHNPLFSAARIIVNRRLFMERLGCLSGTRIKVNFDESDLSDDFVIPDNVWESAQTTCRLVRYRCYQVTAEGV